MLSFDRAFTQPLKKLYEGDYGRSLLLIVDALDEAQIYTGVKLPVLFSRPADLPPQVGILATTRPDPQVRCISRRSIQRQLSDVNAPAGGDDIEAYALARLAALMDTPLGSLISRVAPGESGKLDTEATYAK